VMVMKELRPYVELASRSAKNEMNLQRRISRFILVLVLILSGLLGIFFIQQNYIQSVDKTINEIQRVLTAVDVTSQDKVTTALSYGRDAAIPLSIYLTDESNATSTILERNREFTDLELAGFSNLAKLKSVVIEGEVLVGSVGIEGESRLIIIADKSEATSARNKGFLTLLGLLGFIALIMFLGLRFVVSRDIARERSLIETAERLKIETEQKRLLIDFAGDASHELRTPLTVIKGYLELGKKSAEVLNNPETINKLLSETGRMERTISQLLEVFEIESIPEAQLQKMNISEFLTSKLKVFRETNPERPISESIEDDLRVLSNHELLEKIFGNILSNIARHTSKDASVYVSASRVGETTTISIDDAGPGMDIGDRGRLFTRFDKARSRETGGSGLGLSIVNSAVTKMQGAMEMKKSKQGGLSIELKFPATY